MSSLPSEERKHIPIYTGFLKYFPDAIAEVARCSAICGDKQHHPGAPVHWERGKSTDHEDSLLRHLMEKGTLDDDGVRHSAKVAWRALAILQLEIEDAELEKDAVAIAEPRTVPRQVPPVMPLCNCRGIGCHGDPKYVRCRLDVANAAES